MSSRTPLPGRVSLLLSSKRISYLGPEGTFTDQAAHIYAQDDWERVAYPEMNLVVRALERGDVDEAVAPIENSVGGAVIDIVDFLVRSDIVKIRGELLLKIEQCLIALPGARLRDIKSVASKPEALSQCRNFLASRLPLAERIGTASTVEAVKSIKSGAIDKAAIGPRRAAELTGLPVLADAIQDRKNNVTRFVILAHEDCAPTGIDKTSIIFSFLNRDAPGQLHSALGSFASRAINLTHIESRPTGQKLGDYVFIMDFKGHRADPKVEDALCELRRIASFVKVLGSYPVAEDVI